MCIYTLLAPDDLAQQCLVGLQGMFLRHLNKKLIQGRSSSTHRLWLHPWPFAGSVRIVPRVGRCQQVQDFVQFVQFGHDHAQDHLPTHQRYVLQAMRLQSGWPTPMV